MFLRNNLFFVLIALFCINSRAEQGAIDPSITATEKITCNEQLDSNELTEFQALVDSVKMCFASGQLTTALRLSIKANKIALEQKDIHNILTAQVLQAVALQSMGLFQEALELYGKTRALATPADLKLVASADNNSAVMHISLGQLDEAKVIAESSLSRYRQLNDKNGELTALGTLAAVYVARKEIDQAGKAISACFDAVKILPRHSAIVYCRQTAAELYFLQSNFHLALNQANEALTLAEQENILSDIGDIYLIKARSEAALNDYQSAQLTAALGIAVTETQHDQDSALKLWEFLETLHIKNNNWKSAYDATQHVKNINETIFNKKIANTIAYQIVQRELDQKSQEIELLKKSNEIHQAEANTAKAQRTISLLVAVMVVVAFLFGYSRWMHKRDLQRAQITNQELQRLHDLKDQFLANTTHELRTPLNGIIGLSDILQETEANVLSATGRNQLTLIRDCGAQLSEMVDSILSFSQIRAGKHSLRLEPVELKSVTHSVCSILLPLAQRKNLQLLVELETDELTVLADADRLRQILTNLIGNAIKFTERGHINVIAKRQKDAVLITVKDTGIGIPEDRMHTVFEPFEQVDGSLRRRYGGVGLGLPIARELVHAHGSELFVHSTPNVGSEFQFTLSTAST